MKAYENSEFIHSPEGRLLRIMAEFMEPQRRLRRHNIQDTVVFFGSARSCSTVDGKKRHDELRKKLQGASRAEAPALRDELARLERRMKMSRYYDDAVELAQRMTKWSMSLKKRSKRFIVCSGGGPGMMEAANRGAMEKAKGLSVGFTISMPEKFEGANPYISEDLNFEFHYFFLRKYWFAYLAKALIIFPGGFGTLDELMELLTLVQTKKMTKPMPIVIYGSKYWNEILNLEKMVEWGTIDEADLKLVKFCDTPDEAFSYLTAELTRIHL